MNPLVLLLACYGATTILVSGRIFNAIRPQARFFHCPLCVGWWVGLVLTFLSGEREWFRLFCWAFASSGTSYFLGMLVDDDGLRIK